MKSKLLSLDTRDFIKGAVVAVIVAVISALKIAVENKGIALDMSDASKILETVVMALLAYLSKNFVTDHDDKVVGKF